VLVNTCTGRVMVYLVRSCKGSVAFYTQTNTISFYRRTWYFKHRRENNLKLSWKYISNTTLGKNNIYISNHAYTQENKTIYKFDTFDKFDKFIYFTTRRS